MKTALVLVIENSKTNLGAGISWKSDEFQMSNEPLEEEVMGCIESWKHFQPTIPIYVVCPSNRPPEQTTIDKIEDVGATYIHPELSESFTFTCGYLNVPLALSWFEQNYDYDILIHTDLDMKLIREPREHLFELLHDQDARVGILTPEEMKDVHIGEYEVHHETCFIVGRNGFYTDWWDETKKLCGEYDPKWERYAELEEFAVDVLWKKSHEIVSEIYYQIGERYPVSDIPDEMLDNICFFHSHVYESAEPLAKYKVRLWKYETKKNTT